MEVSNAGVRLTPVDSIHYVWPHIEQSLLRVKEKTGERWSPAYVFDRVSSGNAALFRFHENGEHVAYMVVERLAGYEVVLNVWVLEGTDCYKRKAEFISLLDDLAKSVGASHWKLESPRKGWARVLRGFSTRTVYERKVP